MHDLDHTVGTYQLIRRLGTGGMGEVFLAWDPQLERQVAIKRIRAEKEVSPDALQRFRREARLAAALNHPAIVQIYHLLNEGELDHIVMEYVPGANLRQTLDGGPLPFPEGLDLALELTDGLAYAHRHGILHRDLKTENVLLSEGGQPKIADFGIARRLLSESPDPTVTAPGQTPGTCRVMSPEQARGDRLVNSSDLFSLGVLLYESFTGKSPFLAASPVETLLNVIEKPHPPALEVHPDLPPELSALIDHLLEKDPLLRPRNAEEAMARLREIAEAMGDRGATAGSLTASSWHSRSLQTRAGSQTTGSQTTVISDSVSYASHRPEAAPPTRKRTQERRNGGWLAVGGVVMVIVLGLFFVTLRPPQPAPLTVAILPTEVQGSVEEAALQTLMFGIPFEVHRALLSLEHLIPVTADELSPTAAARTHGADEVLVTRLVCPAGSCYSELRRLSGRDARVLWTSSRIELPLDMPLNAARAIALEARKGYANHRSIAAQPELEARPEDYARWLELKRRFKSGDPQGFATETALAELTAIRDHSPRFVDTYLLAAEILVHRFRTTGEAADAASALVWIERAESTVGDHPEVLFKRSYIELQVDRLAAAEATLERLEAVAPTDVRLLSRRADLLERRGRPAEALTLRRRAAKLQPSCARLRNLARKALESGDLELTRHSLDGLFARCPDHQGGQMLLATVELYHGDPGVAAELFERLAQHTSAQHTSGLVAEINLGLARLLLGAPDRAAQSFEQALGQAPENPMLIANLADARDLQGRREEALTLYRQVIELHQQPTAGTDHGRLSRLALAQAQLGEPLAAVAAIEEALRLAPEETQIALDAALVYTLIGDYTSAFRQAQRAMARGLSPHWLCLPWFDRLRLHADYGQPFKELLPECYGASDGGNVAKVSSSSGSGSKTMVGSTTRSCSIASSRIRSRSAVSSPASIRASTACREMAGSSSMSSASRASSSDSEAA